MFNGFPPAVAFVLAILDYLFKAAVNYRETDEGRAEWLDIEASFQEMTGDTLGADETRADATDSRLSLQTSRTARSERNQSADKINLTGE